MARTPPRFYPGAGPWSGNHVRFTGYGPDKPGLAKCAVGPELHHAVSEIVHGAIAFAELIAPDDSTEYQRSFFTDVKVVPDIPYRVHGEPMARWSGRVGNSSDHAIIVEVGGNHTHDHRIMRRTLQWIEMVSDD